MRHDPTFHTWPSVTTCQLCNKRVYAWQRKERRAHGVHSESHQHLMVYVGGSSLVHKSCKGTPVAGVKIQFGVNQPKTTRV